MEIRNCLIIVADASVVHLDPGEMRAFSGNVVYALDNLPRTLGGLLKEHTGFWVDSPTETYCGSEGYERHRSRQLE